MSSAPLEMKKTWLSCPVCDRRFSQQKYLNQHHLRVHTEKRYSCEYCAKAFALKKDLTYHDKHCFSKYKKTELMDLLERTGLIKQEPDVSPPKGAKSMRAIKPNGPLPSMYPQPPIAPEVAAPVSAAVFEVKPGPIPICPKIPGMPVPPRLTRSTQTQTASIAEQYKKPPRKRRRQSKTTQTTFVQCDLGPSTSAVPYTPIGYRTTNMATVALSPQIPVCGERISTFCETDPWHYQTPNVAHVSTYCDVQQPIMEDASVNVNYQNFVADGWTNTQTQPISGIPYDPVVNDWKQSAASQVNLDLSSADFSASVSDIQSIQTQTDLRLDSPFDFSRFLRGDETGELPDYGLMNTETQTHPDLFQLHEMQTQTGHLLSLDMACQTQHDFSFTNCL